MASKTNATDIENNSSTTVQNNSVKVATAFPVISLAFLIISGIVLSRYFAKFLSLFYICIFYIHCSFMKENFSRSSTNSDFKQNWEIGFNKQPTPSCTRGKWRKCNSSRSSSNHNPRRITKLSTVCRNRKYTVHTTILKLGTDSWVYLVLPHIAKDCIHIGDKLKEYILDVFSKNENKNIKVAIKSLPENSTPD